MPVSRPVVCSIGCSDPWNAAGVGLDVLALRDCGARAVTVVAGVTAQDRDGLLAAAPVAAGLVAAQFDSLGGAGVAAYRIGALLDEPSLDVVAAWVQRSGIPGVYDPVLAPSGGGTFAAAPLIAALARRLVPSVTLVTPNFAEAVRLAGRAEPVPCVEAMERLGRALIALGAPAVLVKGGDLDGPAVDVLVDAGGALVFEAPRLPGTMRGTGCLLSCGIAAALALGSPLRDAVAAGRAFVRARFETAVETGGMRVAY